jgi:hypothetical protein
MADDNATRAQRLGQRLMTVRYGMVFLIAFALLVVLLGMGITAGLTAIGGDATYWTKLGNVGQALASVDAIFSALGLIAIVITFWFQYQELKLQRLELESQRQALDGSQSALSKSAEADLRTLHVDLLKMSINDCDLAKVWPWFETEMSDVAMKQFLYANLIMQHHRLAFEIGQYNEADMRLILRRLFESALIRDYWRISFAERSSMLPPDSAGWSFERLVHEAFSESTDPPDHDLRVA